MLSMNHNQKEKPWIYDYKELLDFNKIFDVLPDDLTFNGMLTTKSLNAISRFILLIGVISYIRRPNFRIILLTMIVLFIIVQLFSYTKDIRQHFEGGYKMLNGNSSKNILEQLNEEDDRTLYDVSLNNPYNNPNPYSNCQDTLSEKSAMDSQVFGVGSRKIMNIGNVLRNDKPSDTELMLFQQGLIGEREPFGDLTVSSDDIDVLKRQQINSTFRQFYTMPVNDCVNNQKDFAISLFGDPEKPIFKQKVYTTNLRNN